MSDAILTLDVVEALWRMATQSVGFSIDEIGITEDGTSRIRVKGRGWSPSLHATEIAIYLDVEGRLDDVARATAAFEGLAAGQAARAADARKVGIPLPTNIHESGIRHLHADISGMGFSILESLKRTTGDEGEDAWRRNDPVGSLLTSAAGAVGLAHNANSASTGGPALRANGCIVLERGGVRVVGLRSVLLNLRDGATASMTTRTDTGEPVLRLAPSASRMHVPEMALTAMTGRRVGDLAPIHAVVDDRIVTHAESSAGNIVLTLEPLDVPFAAIIGSTGDEALERLSDILDSHIRG